MACSVHTDAANGQGPKSGPGPRGQDRDRPARAWPGLRLRVAAQTPSPAPPLPPPPRSPACTVPAAVLPASPGALGMLGGCTFLGGSDMPHLPPSTKRSSAPPHLPVMGKLSPCGCRGRDRVLSPLCPGTICLAPLGRASVPKHPSYWPQGHRHHSYYRMSLLCSLFSFIVSYC